MVAFEDMTIVQLKERLTARGLPKTGNKAELIARLRAKSPGKKSPGKKSPGKKSPGKKSPGKKSPGKKTFAGARGAHKSMKSAATSRRKTPAKKSPAKKVPAKKSPAKKVPAKKSPAKKVPAKKSPAKKVPASPRHIKDMSYIIPPVKANKSKQKTGKLEPFYYITLDDENPGRSKKDWRKEKNIKEAIFEVGQGGGPPYYKLKFRGLKTEKEAVKAIEEFLSGRLDKAWYDHVTDGIRDFDDVTAKTRGELLEDHRIYDGSSVKNGVLTLYIGS
jgi:SAP domain